MRVDLKLFCFFNCQQQSKPWILRLISLSCVSLSAKMRKPEISVSDLPVTKKTKTHGKKKKTESLQCECVLKCI